MTIRTRLHQRCLYLPLTKRMRTRLAARVADIAEGHEATGNRLTKADVRREIEGVVGSPWMVWLAMQLLWPLVLEWLRERRGVE